MAAEVPVSDILCEAMEYLSKLGSNLRTRSENLKEKRISKAKLKNSHAVQKAASKVLLICELSKKSLENVETGVRKVLSLLEASQAPSAIGGKTRVKNQYQYFEYQSRKLRIAKKIPLKHYMSVKVLAYGMPASMQEKYPVYYNCKLKRLREKQAATQRSKKRDSFSHSDRELDSVTIDSSGDDDREDNSKVDEADKISSKSKKNHSKNEKNIISVDYSLVDCEDNTNSKVVSDADHEITESLKKNSRQSSLDVTDKEQLDNKKSEKVSPTKSKDHSHDKKRKRIRFADVYSSDSDKESPINEIKKDIFKENNSRTDKENIQDSVSSEPKSKKLKLTESNDDSNSQIDSDCGITKVSLASNEKEISDNDGECRQQSDNDSTQSKICESQTESGGEAKQFIRCVNLSKLLKPDALQLSNKLSNDQPLKKNKSSLNRQSNRKDWKHTKCKKENDDEFWAHKRKEVSEFKPKKFSININRLPNFSVSFLLANKLKKIIKQGEVICEIKKEIDSPSLIKLREVKNALLNDSESDECEETAKVSKVKKSILKVSDSENNTSDNRQSKKSDKRSNVNKENEKVSSEAERTGIDNVMTTNDVQLESNSDNRNENLKGNDDKTPKPSDKDSDTHKTQNLTGNDACTTDTNDPKTPIKTNETIIESFNDSSNDFAGFSYSDIESPTKTNNKIKSLLLNDSSDEKSEKNKKDMSTKAKKKLKSASTSDEKSNKNKDSLHANANEELKSSLLNDSSDEKSNKEKNYTSTKTDKKSKFSLLKDSSEERLNKEADDSPSKANKKSKSFLLNYSSDEKSNKEEDDAPTKSNKKLISSVSNDSSGEKSNKEEDDASTKANKKLKSSVLNESSAEKSNKEQDDVSTKANNMLFDSSDEKSNKEEDDGVTMINKKSKSSQLTAFLHKKSNKEEDIPSTNVNKKSKSLLNYSSDEKSNKEEDNVSTRANKKLKSSVTKDSSCERSNKEKDDASTRENKKSKSSRLIKSSDEKSNKEEDNLSINPNKNSESYSSEEKSNKEEDYASTKTNKNLKSSVSNDSSSENSNENDNESPTKVNEKLKSSLLNDSSDEKSSKTEDDSPTKTNEKLKSTLINESSDENSNKNEDSPTKVNEKIKSSLLNDSSDEKSSKPDDDSLTKTNEKLKSSLLNDSSDEKSSKSEDDSPTKTNEKLKSSLLNDSSDEKLSKNEDNSPTKTNEKLKSSLLKDSSDEKSNKNEDDSSTKANEKLKSSLLNDSSDVKSDDSDGRKEKQKTPKAKRKHARKCREAKQKLKFCSSSDSEQEKPSHRSRKKSHVPTSSSSSDDNNKKSKKKKLRLDSEASDNDKTIDQIDGAVDEHSNSSVNKMVRSKAKPSGSSSQNSDNQDASDKDIDGLTNLNSLNKIRRRDTSRKSRDEDRQREKKRGRSNPTPIIGEDLLKSASSSEVSDDGQNDVDQELPQVSLSGLNGDSIDHMAKDDLLGESDSSVSNNDKEQSENPSNSDEDANVKSKRRKANAISSDSEGGSHRRKIKEDEEERMSDFEDSEADSSEPAKKAKRKTRVTDSDASGDSNDGGKKKRRRIKVVKDSDVSGSDTENEGRNKHGRKNIRKVMGKNQLEEATKKAAREEKERIARITERQKLYNNLDFDESGKPDEVVLEKVILDFDPETKEPLIQVDRGLVKKLKPHQANGIKFMWDACFESVKRIKKDKGSGCILAHCMGLGKTLQVISLTHTLLIHGNLTGVNRVLVVCPLSTVLNWVNEFRMWLKHADSEYEVDVYELSRYKQNSERAFQLQQWFDGGGVCVLGYEMFRNLSADNNKKFKKKILKSFQESLVEPGPDLVVCDEGHLLKNEKTSLSQSMNRVKTRRRIVLTGTPLQNNLKEYYCMVQFVKPNLLGKYNEYLNRFVNPITNGQYTDSTEHDIRVMKRRSHVLHKMLDGAVQRRDYGVLAPFLPPKHEYVLFITLTDVQIKLYQFYLDNYSRRPLPGKSSGFLFPDFQSLQRIWTHPLVLKYNSERYEIMQQKKREREEEDSEGSLVDFIDDDSTPDESSTEESSDDLSDMSDDSRKKSKKKKSAKKSKAKDSKASTRRGTRANPVELEEEEHENDEVVEVKNENPTEWWIKLVEESELDDMRNSHKLVLLFDILRQCETIGDKLLVFSQSLYSLDLIEHFLGKVDEATQEGRIDEKLGGHVGSWSPGVDYFRLDGSTSCENRSIWCKNFNKEDNPRARLFLISTRAGGLGINLVAANRVVIFDVSWNPSHDVQSIFRVYRFGQKKPCYVYRFLAMGTMEEKIYERQVTKQAISKRVIDEQQIDRHYAENDLAELYKFEARPDEPRPLPTLPKDRLFAEMLKEHEAQIYKYHEHDSLLENKEEETLSEEERKAAWEDFENEKNKPPPAPFPSAWPMHNGMVPGLLAQQQQQLAYAALAAMLRKDMPNISDNQIRDMLPLIYNSNPAMFGGYDYGMMQKMGEIYKYAQPGMMNLGMMNPVMNAGSGGGSLGGSSGLQYEPPWQRQHQQQQQMRLQQLMQQQNAMGAKFYAGGLGSRDPIAMALQQQRAREIMMGGAAAGRPRGRPPLQARPPTTTSQDVVNLDSD